MASLYRGLLRQAVSHNTLGKRADESGAVAFGAPSPKVARPSGPVPDSPKGAMGQCARDFSSRLAASSVVAATPTHSMPLRPSSSMPLRSSSPAAPARYSERIRMQTAARWAERSPIVPVLPTSAASPDLVAARCGDRLLVQGQALAGPSDAPAIATGRVVLPVRVAPPSTAAAPSARVPRVRDRSGGDLQH